MVGEEKSVLRREKLGEGKSALPETFFSPVLIAIRSLLLSAPQSHRINNMLNTV